MTASVIFVIASEGYQPVEFSVPKKILEQAGFMVTVASDKPGTAIAADNSTTHVDIVIDNVIIDNYSAIVFIGGPGTLEHLDNEVCHTLIKKAHQTKKIIAAICISPRILAATGILKGKRATGWDGDGQLKSIFNKHGVTLERRPVVVDGLFITAVGPTAAQQFGTKLMEKLS